MSLVDYASSDEEDEVVRDGGCDDVVPQQKPHPEKPHRANESSKVTSLPSKLPDASVLLNGPSLPSNKSGIYDHTSAVAAAMAQNESRKRDLKESADSYRRGKIPKGNLLHSKIVQKTASGLLCPPQLSGRSNVVTEDIKKLFTRRNVSESQSSISPSES